MGPIVLNVPPLRAVRAGFSLIELVIVVVIIGVIGAIAIPRISRGAEGATEAQLIANLNVLRNAIDRCAVEHEGLYPSGDHATFVQQMTMYTDIHGNVSPVVTNTHIYGPYLRRVPRLPLGSNKGADAIVDATEGAIGDGEGAWFYDETTGTVRANLKEEETTVDGRLLNQL